MNAPSSGTKTRLYMLDTNVVSAEFRGATPVGQRLRTLQPGQWCVSAVTWSELCFGVALKPEATRLARLVQAFGRIARIMPWDEQAAQQHGRLRAGLRLQGTPIGDFDEMIAAHALSLGAVLVTNNVRHFSRVPGLEIENWLGIQDK